MRLPNELEGLRSSKLMKIVTGGSVLAVSGVAVAQALDVGQTPDVSTIGLHDDDLRANDVKLDLEGNTIAVPADTLLADNVDDTNDSADNSPAGTTNDSPDNSPGVATSDSPDDSVGGGSADDS